MVEIQKVILVAKKLRTRYEAKKHGGYDIYEDDKIEIVYDTYYPNVDVYIKLHGGERTATHVLSYSGHGITEEYHPGLWEKYIENELYPQALVIYEMQQEKQKQKEAKDHKGRFAPIDDRVLFSIGILRELKMTEITLDDKDYEEYNHIPDAKIRRDIVDTQREINIMSGSISRRRDFIQKLNRILEYRRTQNVIL